jgi:site-specific recombinase XerD
MFNKKAKGDRPPLKSTRLLDRLRERIRYLHYSLRTEKTYVYWVRSFVHWHQLRHPADMGKAEVEAYLSWLAGQRRVSPSTHRQALSALLFLYKEVLKIELPWLDQIGRPKKREPLPTVLSRDEVERLLTLMSGKTALLARLLYGSGMRKKYRSHIHIRQRETLNRVTNH